MSLPEAQRNSIEDIEKMVGGQTRLLRAPWMRFFMAYDPRPTLSRVQ